MPMGELRAIIYDLDGVLADTQNANLKAYEAAFAKLDLPWSPRVARDLTGASFSVWIETLCPWLQPERREALASLKRDLYPTFFEHLVANASLVSQIRARVGKLPQCVASTASRANGEAVLDFLGMTHLFEFSVFNEDVENPKPDPECYSLCMDRLSLHPSECLILEDSAVGLKAARRSGAAVMRVLPWSAGSTPHTRDPERTH